MIQAGRSGFLLLLLLILATGCQVTQTTFDRTASNAGATFAAASVTLSYAHEGKITAAYARSSFENYQSQLSGLDQQMPSQQGVPDKRTTERLLALYGQALKAVNQPCLDASCNWRTQVEDLNRASKAFLEVSGQ